MASNLIPYNGEGQVDPLQPGQYLTTYDRADKAQAFALFRAVQGSDFALDDCIGSEVEVTHIVAHVAPMVDKDTGEVAQTVRSVLIGPDGTRYSTRSETVQADIQRAAALLGRVLPWKPALRFVVRQVANRAKSRKYLQLELVGIAGE